MCIAPAVFGMDTPPLLAALERYVRDPQARAELCAAPGGGYMQVAPARAAALMATVERWNLCGRAWRRFLPRFTTS